MHSNFCHIFYFFISTFMPIAKHECMLSIPKNFLSNASAKFISSLLIPFTPFLLKRALKNTQKYLKDISYLERSTTLRPLLRQYFLSIHRKQIPNLQVFCLSRLSFRSTIEGNIYFFSARWELYRIAKQNTIVYINRNGLCDCT